LLTTQKTSADIADWKDENFINMHTVISLDNKNVISFGISATAPGIGLAPDAKNKDLSIIVSIIKFKS